MAKTAKERSEKWWKDVTSNPVRYERLKENRRNARKECIYDPEKQKRKADEILKRIGLKVSQ